jgi:hypothetical protein
LIAKNWGSWTLPNTPSPTATADPISTAVNAATPPVVRVLDDIMVSNDPVSRLGLE